MLLMHWPDAWLPNTTEQPDDTVTIEQTWYASQLHYCYLIATRTLTR